MSQEEVKNICTDQNFRNLFKCMKKLYTSQCQLDFMIKCKLNNVIPKGINDQCIFTLSFHNPSLGMIINELFQATKSRVLDILIFENQKIIKHLRRNFYQNLRHLQSLHNTVDVECSLTKFNKYFLKVIESLQKTHSKKLENLLKKKDQHAYIESEIRLQTAQPTKSQNKKNRKLDKQKKKKKSRLNKKQIQNKMVKGKDSVKINDKMILNLTDKQLTNDQKEVLTLGPNFAPNPEKPNLSKRDDDIDNWMSKIRWCYFFSKPERQNQQKRPFQEIERALIPASGRTAPKSDNHALELYLSLTAEDLKKTGLIKNSYDNLNPQHRDALKQMQSWDDTVFRYFDKGVGWVIDSNKGYEQKVMDHLGDHNTFTPVNSKEDTSPIPVKIAEITEKIQSWADIFEEAGEISSKIAKWVVPVDSRPGYDYANYKVHKPNDNYPGRLITSCCGSPTQNLAEFSEYYLQPIALSLPHVLKDTSSFLFEVEKFNAEYQGNFDDIILVTWDIVAMFPSLDNEMGLKSCEEQLNKRTNKFPSTKCIVDATRITLENNISYFDNVAYIQNNGTAMGPGNACSYADIAFHPFDVIINSNSEFPIVLWDRYKDDVFNPWTNGLEKLFKFNIWLNSLDPKIRYTMKYSLSSGPGVEYLNTQAYIKDSKIHTTRFDKPSDTHAYLNPNSCHPKHVCKNVPNGIAQSTRRICSEVSEYEKHKETSIQHFVDRGYNMDFVKEIYDKFDSADRMELIGDPEVSFDDPEIDSNKTDRRFPLVLDFHPSFSGASRSLNKFKHILQVDEKLCKIINPDRIFVTFRRSKTLGDQLVHSRYPYTKNTDNTNNNGNKNCQNCNLCKNFLSADTKVIKSCYDGKNYFINKNITCTDEHVIYVIDDSVCIRQNVGSTDNIMRLRFSNHKSHIKTKFINVRWLIISTNVMLKNLIL